MNFLDLAKSRYSVRAYKEQAVGKEKLDIILAAGQVAPTGANRQPQRLIVLQSDEGLSKVGKAANIFGAPLVIITCTDKDETWIRPMDGKKLTDIDASIVTDHMMLAATELGLGSVWICHFKKEVIREEFNLPDSWEPINVLAIGYADTEREVMKLPSRHKRERKELSETVFFERISE